MKESRCGNERQEGLAGGKRVEKENAKKFHQYFFTDTLQEGVLQDRLHRDIKLCSVPLPSHTGHLPILLNLPQASQPTTGKKLFRLL